MIFGDGFHTLVKEALQEREYDKEMRKIMETAKIVRKDIFDHSCPKFDGEFNGNSQSTSIPTSLLTLVTMILYGPSIKDEEANF